MKRNHILILIFVILIVLICLIVFFVRNLNKPVPTPAPSIEISYSYSTGPLMGVDEIVIDNDGNITLTNKSISDREEIINETKTGKLSAEELKELKDLIVKADVFSLKDDYGCIEGCVVDGTSRSIKFNIDGATKTILNYEGNFPEKLEVIVNKIEGIRVSLSRGL